MDSSEIIKTYKWINDHCRNQGLSTETKKRYINERMDKDAREELKGGVRKMEVLSWDNSLVKMSMEDDE